MVGESDLNAVYKLLGILIAENKNALGAQIIKH